MNCIKYFLIAVAVLINTGVLYSQDADAFAERVYLQTDKNSYIAGELVWLKAITTDPNGRPVDLSKVVYVELLAGTTPQAKVKLSIGGSAGSGTMLIPSSVSTGNYRLVAYTRYMRNESPAVFFEKCIAVVNPFKNDDVRGGTTVSHAQDITGGGNIGPLRITADKTTYGRRSEVKLGIDGLPEDIHTLSVSVAGSELVPVTASDIAPRTIIADGSTAGSPVGFMPEYEGHIITARLLDADTGQPVQDGDAIPLLGFTGGDIKVFSGQKRENGEVLFYTRHIEGTGEIATTVANPGSGRYRLEMQPPYETAHREIVLPALDRLTIDKDALQKRMFGVQVLYSYANDSLNRFAFDAPTIPAGRSRVYILEDYTRFPTMPEVITEFITGVRFRRVDGRQQMSVSPDMVTFYDEPALVLLDGIPVFDHDAIYNYNPLNLERIDVYHDTYVFGGFSASGIVALYSKNGNYPGLKPDGSTSIVRFEGTQPQRLFYIPPYDSQAHKLSSVPDFRHTLYWNPEIVSQDGATSPVSFHTSDVPVSYTAVIEGLTRGGVPVRASISFTVE